MESKRVKKTYYILILILVIILAIIGVKQEFEYLKKLTQLIKNHDTIVSAFMGAFFGFLSNLIFNKIEEKKSYEKELKQKQQELEVIYKQVFYAYNGICMVDKIISSIMEFYPLSSDKENITGENPVIYDKIIYLSNWGEYVAKIDDINEMQQISKFLVAAEILDKMMEDKAPINNISFFMGTRLDSSFKEIGEVLLKYNDIYFNNEFKLYKSDGKESGIHVLKNIFEGIANL